MTILLSIIVPVYNVEEYLQQCVNSILNQRFTHFELILVDDGSKDNCGKLCDEYKKLDDRIVVIHKQNGGLSSARNEGLNVAKGRYVSFIDSDDYIEGDIYTRAIDIMEKESDVDMVWLNYYSLYDDGRKEYHNNTIEYYVKKEDSSLLNQLVNKEALAWLKIYRKRVFYNIRYPEGKILEDLYVVPDLFYAVNKIFVSNIGYIVYRQRNGSICHRKHTENMICDIATSYAKVIELLQNTDRKEYIRKLATYSSGYLNAIVLFPQSEFSYLKEKYNSFTYSWNEVIESSIKISQKIKLLLIKLFGYQRMVIVYKYIYKVKHK